jgi:hypothetical protein
MVDEAGQYENRVIHTGGVRDVSVSSSSDNCGNIASALGNEGN